ncbi:MAG: putative sulfate exporter family transporter [Polaromonas sp.]|nr:putative sulfate exporter family transporter [Polaromonas sp.]
MSIAGLGMKTQLRELAAAGLKPVLLMVGETLFPAGLALALLRWPAPENVPVRVSNSLQDPGGNEYRAKRLLGDVAGGDV